MLTSAVGLPPSPNQVKRNLLNASSRIAQYTDVISDLRREIERLKSKTETPEEERRGDPGTRDAQGRAELLGSLWFCCCLPPTPELVAVAIGFSPHLPRTAFCFRPMWGERPPSLPSPEHLLSTFLSFPDQLLFKNTVFPSRIVLDLQKSCRDSTESSPRPSMSASKLVFIY